ncbi:MAG TPA: AmmeMemoRadiSam system protein B [Phycisphaerae bacterium]|nr:AmmeMemoRadiSam system protein B [Phycisphaerae bacterium]
MHAQGIRRLMVSAVVIGTVALGAGLARGGEPAVRPAYCAGSWYPLDAEDLAKNVDDLLAKASPPEIEGKPLAVISPHAGYRFSAPVAAAGYRCLKGHTYKRAIVMAFSHRNASGYRGVDVPSELTAYQTPLGDVPIDREVCDRLLANPVFASNPDVDSREHSLELQLPFLQRTLGEFKLVPLLVGRMDAAEYAAAARAIVPFIDDETLLVASTDFTHYGSNFGYRPFTDDVPNKLRELADQAAAPLLACDFDGFAAHLARTGDTICGRGPVSLLLRILSMRGGAKGVRAAFDTSGNMTNEWDSSVTYQSFVFTERPGSLGASERDTLLRLARQTATAYLNNKPAAEVNPDTLPAGVRADGACFVTLENHGRLRGCIGNMEATGPLYEAVVHNAVQACRDSRFVDNPVTSAELDRIDVEISYLTPLKQVTDTNEIVIGRHGLWLVLPPQRGVLLPQVAYERGWTREEFLAQTCGKAGLPPDAWKRPEAQIYSFEAEVFGEPEPNEK